ncbi:hypothetical protein LXA43DRAFT_893772 [Ganoderma leucocontextum]|nr:hypothetical protein LXA43DRAFT_893772 [Ganoderma leucocontextum]
MISISAMLPPNRSATIPALALVTQIDLAVEGEDYKIRCEYPNCIAASMGSVHPPLTLYIDNVPAVTWNSFMAQGLDDIVECYGRSPLTCLTVSGNHGYATVVAWERVFRTFPLLEKLNIGGRTMCSVSKVFLGLHAASSNHSDSPVACPNLKNVRVEGLGSADTYEAMRECFRYRGDRGAILQALNLVGLFDVTSELRLAFRNDLFKAVDFIHTK